MEFLVALGDTRKVFVEHVDGPSFAGTNGCRDLEGAHGSSPSTGGTRNWPASAAGGLRKHFFTVDRWGHVVSAQHVDQWQWMRRRRNVAHVERLDVGRMGKDVAELTGEKINLVIVEIEAGQPGDMHHIVSGDSFRHEDRGYARDDATLRGDLWCRS